MEAKGAAAGLVTLLFFALLNVGATEAPIDTAFASFETRRLLPDVNALPPPTGEVFQIRRSVPPLPVETRQPWKCKGLPYPMTGYAQPVNVDRPYLNAVYL